MAHPFDALSLDELRRRTSQKWRVFDPDVLPVWVAEMDFPLAEPIRRVLDDMAARGDTGYTTKTPLPETYADFASRRHGWDVDPSRIVVTLDVMRGIYLALQLFTAPGDGVIVNPPVYPPFFSTIPFAGRHVVEAPLAFDRAMGRWDLDLDAVAGAFARGATAYLLCSPHNPVGRVWPRATLEGVLELAERHRAVLLIDEVHGPLTYPEQKHVPLASIDSLAARRAVTFTSASKAWNMPGLKCALTILGSAETVEPFDRLPDEVREEPSIFGVAANQVAFAEGESWLNDTLDYLDRNRRLLAELLGDRIPAIRFDMPEATYLAWLDCRDVRLGDDPAAAFLDRGRVALSPGPTFGTGGASFARFNFATSRALVTEAVERMARAMAASG